MKGEKISFCVTGMTCAACARRVEKALSSVTVVSNALRLRRIRID
jgi:copper chaperone CopZ